MDGDYEKDDCGLHLTLYQEGRQHWPDLALAMQKKIIIIIIIVKGESQLPPDREP